MIFLEKLPDMVVPHPGVPIHINGLTLIPYEGLHFRDGNGVPEMGYLAEFSGKRWAFPGDTRVFPAGGLGSDSPPPQLVDFLVNGPTSSRGQSLAASGLGRWGAQRSAVDVPPTSCFVPEGLARHLRTPPRSTLATAPWPTTQCWPSHALSAPGGGVMANRPQARGI